MTTTAESLPKTAAEVFPVREVTLVAEAELAPFAHLLKAEALRPAEFDGAARLFFSATETRFHGIRFREFSVSVLVESDSQPAVFLIQAYNSVRFFAWVERTMFSTPYHHARIAVEPAFPAGVAVERHGVPLFLLRMNGADDRTPLRQGEETWHGRIYLPTKPGRKAADDAKMFFGTLSGDAVVYAASADDQITFAIAADRPFFELLNSAHIRPVEWLLRTAGRHMKTKTVARGWS